MKTAALYLWATLAALLAGCESHPTTHTAAGTAASEAATDSVALMAAVVSARRFLAELSEARQAVLRQATLPTDTAASLVPKPASPILLGHPAQLRPGFSQNHRYVGTLGGQPVVLELTGEQGYHYVSGYEHPYYDGSYYFAWGGQSYTVSSEGYDPDQPLRLIETRIPNNQYTDDPADQPDTTGTWQAVERLGPVLTGTWTDKRTRRTARFKLREDYTGAIRYEEVDVRMQAKDSCRVQEKLGFYEARLRYAAQRSLHLLGPDTLRPALRRMQCPTPQPMQQRLAALLAQTNCKGSAFGIQKYRIVHYNDTRVLSLTDVTDTIGVANLPSQSVEEHTYDLATGKECRVADWLRPDKRREVQQLAVVYYNARHADEPAPGRSPHLKQQLPAFLITSAGIAFRFFTEDALDDGQPHITHSRPIVIPYAAVAPYVQPGTPLARLVAARARPGR